VQPAHRTGRSGGIDVTVRQIARLETTACVTYSEQLGMRGWITLQNDVVATFADNRAVAHDNSTISLIALPCGLVAQRVRARKITGFRFLVWLRDQGLSTRGGGADGEERRQSQRAG
jgi:hypothetical protein